MSFDISDFSPEFFFAEGEPYDRTDLALNSKNKPISVWSAIGLALEDDKEKTRIAEYLDIEPEYLTAEMVLDAIRNVDTCTDLTSPVEVWIDDDGWCTLLVYDKD